MITIGDALFGTVKRKLFKKGILMNKHLFTKHSTINKTKQRKPKPSLFDL